MSYEIPGKVAKHVNVSRTTLLSAADRGDIRSQNLSLGTKLIHIKDAETFAKEKHVPLKNKGILCTD